MQPVLFEMEPSAIRARLGRARVTPIDVKQILTKPTGSLSTFDYALNPYIGCGFGCSYCYAMFFQWDAGKRESWGDWIDVKRNAVEVLRAKRDLKGKYVFMSSATDPYQPLEGKLELTRRLVEVMSEPWRQPRLVVQTRGPLVVRDLDLLRRFQDVRVNMSITTDSDEIRKRFEPSCASIEQRLEAVRQVREAGIPCYVSIMPMLPIESPERFAAKIRATRATGTYTCWFHDTGRQFGAANTRPGAWQLCKEMGWTHEKFLGTKATLKRLLSDMWG